MTVAAEDLEARIADVVRRVKDPRAGLYGPGSVSWRVNREAAVMLGGGRAALLQLAHPYVAYAVDQHSATRHDPVGRFRRTFENVFAMVFGDLDAAIACARRVHAVHAKIRGAIHEHSGRFARGHRYQANDEAALFWVQATLIDTAVQVYELLVAPLSLEDKQRYYEESRLFSGLFGIPDEAMPSDWPAFRRYFDAMLASDAITMSPPAQDMARFLFQPPRPIAGPAVGWYKIFTASLLPPRLRAELAMSWTDRDEAIARRTTALLRVIQARTPRRLRFFPDYVEAMKRVKGQAPRDPVGRLMEKIALKAIEPPRARRTA
ncbi:MAG: oxygenase MpaB family protein [Sandaracinus sp.]